MQRPEVVLCLVLSSGLAGCDWVSFSSREPGPRGAEDAGPVDGGSEDAAEPDSDPCAEVDCPGERICSGGDCLDPRVDQDEDGSPVSSDCDDHDSDVVPGSTRPCETACGTGLETCGNGEWEACSAPIECDCSPGAERIEPCGRCGRSVRRCEDAGVWGPASACEDEGECVPSTSEAEDCDAGGSCGQRSRTCAEACTWEAWQACESIAECAPGAAEDRECGVCGTQDRACTAGCLWGAFSPCVEARDVDGDGHDALGCGGDDCDDGVAAIHPGQEEVEAWEIEAIDLGDAHASRPGVVLGPEGEVHACFESRTLVFDEGDVVGRTHFWAGYATNRDGAWATESFRELQQSGCDVVVDGAGDAHVVYGVRHQSGEDTLHAWGLPGAFETETVVTGGEMVSAALGPDGELHFTYHTEDELRLAQLADERWGTSRVSRYPDYPAPLVFDADGDLVVAFQTADADRAFWVATREDGVWSYEELTSLTGSLHAVGVDSEGAVVLGFSSGAIGAEVMAVARQDRVGWETGPEGEPDTTPRGWEFDERGGSHVVTAIGSLAYWTDESGVWVSETVLDQWTPAAAIAVDTRRVVLLFTDSADAPWIARRDRPNGVDDDCDGEAR